MEDRLIRLVLDRMHEVVIMLLPNARGVQLFWKDGLEVFKVQGVLTEGAIDFLGFA